MPMERHDMKIVPKQIASNEETQLLTARQKLDENAASLARS